jgi:uncharacterized protein (TIGR02453 family)
VRDPFLRFVADLAPRLKTISPHFVADPSPVGGSMMRIYRDTPILQGQDSVQDGGHGSLRARQGKGGRDAGVLSAPRAGDSSVGAGIWRPEPVALKRIRKAIVDDSQTWRRIKDGREFRSSCGMAGESLKRPPPGFAADHPFIEDLKRKDFATSAALDDGRVASASFMDVLVDAFGTSAPFVEFLTRAVGLKF